MPELLLHIIYYIYPQDRLSSSRLKLRIASKSCDLGSGVVGVDPADALRPPDGFRGFSCMGGGAGGAGVDTTGWEVGRSFTWRTTGLGALAAVPGASPLPWRS